MDLAAALPRPRFGRTITTRELVCWAALLFAAAQAADLLHVEPGGTIGGNLSAMDAIGLIAWGSAALLLWRDRDGATPARPWQIGVLLALAAGGALATGRGMFAALSVAGLVIALGGGWSANQRRAGAILFGIGFQKLGAKAIAMLLADVILKLDTAAAGTALQLLVPGTTWSGTVIKPPHDVGIVVQMPCSSFANLSLICLCYTSLAALDGARWSRRNLMAVAAICVVMVLLNTVRMMLMARSLPAYKYWHEGDGNTMFAILMSIAAVTLCSMGSRWANAPR